MPLRTNLQPDFLVIGAQKAGSTWIFRVLEHHPQVFVPQAKELEYFSYSPRVANEWGAYLRHFVGAGAAAAIGEATPSYLWASDRDWTEFPRPAGFNPNIPRSVRERLGDSTRLVASLRDPVERAVSAYLHHLRKGRIAPGTSILDAGKAFGILHMGLYFEHLSAWLREFPLGNFHVGIFEEAVRSPREYFAGLFAFLGVDASFQGRREDRAFNTGTERVEVDGAVHVTQHAPAADPAVPLISESELARLSRFYRDDVLRLEDLLGRPLGHWRSLSEKSLAMA